MIVFCLLLNHQDTRTEIVVRKKQFAQKQVLTKATNLTDDYLHTLSLNKSFFLFENNLY
jgi:hypothetical protein